MTSLSEVPVKARDVFLFRGVDPVSHAICFMEAKTFGRGDFSIGGRIG